MRPVYQLTGIFLLVAELIPLLNPGLGSRFFGSAAPLPVAFPLFV